MTTIICRRNATMLGAIVLLAISVHATAAPVIDGRLDPSGGPVAGRHIDGGHGGVLAAAVGPLPRTISSGERR